LIFTLSGGNDGSILALECPTTASLYTVCSERNHFAELQSWSVVPSKQIFPGDESEDKKQVYW